MVDGEPEITLAAKQRFAREWREDGPSLVTVYSFRDNTNRQHRFPTRREAERFAYANGGDMAIVTAIR